MSPEVGISHTESDPGTDPHLDCDTVINEQTGQEDCVVTIIVNDHALPGEYFSLLMSI